jgi:PAS domain S-box-containing protein
MMHAPIRVLLVEDAPAQARLVREYLLSAAGGIVVSLEHVSRLSDGHARLAGGGITLLLLDLDLPDSAGFSTLENTHACFPTLPIIVLTGVNDEELGDRLVQAGAQDYLVKDQINGLILYRAIRHAIDRKHFLEEMRRERDLLDQASLAGRVALWDLDLASGALTWSRQAGAVLGCATSELPHSRREWEDRVYVDDRAAVREAFDLHLAKNAPYEVVYRAMQPDGSIAWWHEAGSVVRGPAGIALRLAGTCADITERKRIEQEKERLNGELIHALAEVKTLSGLLPICAWCKKIRDDKGYWNHLEHYISEHSEARFTHGLCPECAQKHYAEFDPTKSQQHVEGAGFEGPHACKDGCCGQGLT